MKPARILVVDDEPGIRQSLCGVLGDDGYLAHAVSSGEESLEDLSREPSDLVLLDIFHPDVGVVFGENVVGDGQTQARASAFG